MVLNMITDKDMSGLLSLCEAASPNPAITHDHDREFYKAAKLAVPELIGALKDKFSWPVILDTLTRNIEGLTDLLRMSREDVEACSAEIKKLQRQREVARKAIVALLDARDFLAYQLTHANGGMTDEQLDEIAKRYVGHNKGLDEEELQAAVVELASLISDRLDAEVISTVFSCKINQASRVLIRAATEAAKLEGSS